VVGGAARRDAPAEGAVLREHGRVERLEVAAHTSYEVQVTRYTLQVTSYKLQVTRRP